ncbi:hypothetical protein PVAP13_1NG100219 [Panicum virgatum]|uniref:Uncharacterized protein n=1 Tax=Panicum virgatum TaxID=38727 RepID=A0A8T0WR53_PANVG|nr:hypothetical protein PVAP13_1NG100219 [Panicum virgatum]
MKRSRRILAAGYPLFHLLLSSVSQTVINGRVWQAIMVMAPRPFAVAVLISRAAAVALSAAALTCAFRAPDISGAGAGVAAPLLERPEAGLRRGSGLRGNSPAAMAQRLLRAGHRRVGGDAGAVRGRVKRHGGGGVLPGRHRRRRLAFPQGRAAAGREPPPRTPCRRGS